MVGRLLVSRLRNGLRKDVLKAPISPRRTFREIRQREDVPEAIRVRVSSGTAATVYVDGLDDPIDGRVRWVASESAFTPYFALTEHDRGRLTFAAKVDLDYTGKRLPDGVPVEVTLELSSR